MFLFMRKIKFSNSLPLLLQLTTIALSIKKKNYISKVIMNGGKWKTSYKMVNMLDDIDEIILKGLSLWTLTF